MPVKPKSFSDFQLTRHDMKSLHLASITSLALLSVGFDFRCCSQSSEKTSICGSSSHVQETSLIVFPAGDKGSSSPWSSKVGSLIGKGF